MESAIQNIFSSLASDSGSESFQTLFETSDVKIERIVSHSHASAKDFWYDQKQTEWVLVLQGDAILEFENGKQVRMKTGDYLLIPKNTRHRVERTSKEAVWLAIHLQD